MTLYIKPAFNSVWAETGNKLVPTSAKIRQGWVVEIPPYEQMNWIQNRQDQMLAHVNQRGVASWDSTTEYIANVSYVTGPTNGLVYRAVQSSTGVNPETANSAWTLAFQAADVVLLKNQNLADVPDKAAARTNLGIATTADYDNRYLIKNNNFADVPNKASARGNLGLGNSAVLNVGTVGNTVAAGDDSRIVNATPNGRGVYAGGGLTGGGNFQADRAISLGTPSTVTAFSGNSVSGSTHTHAIDFGSAFQYNGSENGYALLPGGMRMVWGVTGLLSEGTYFQPFHLGSFPTTCSHLQLTVRAESWSNDNEIVVASLGHSKSGFNFGIGFMTNYNACYVQYLAIGF